jgi:hypothetical protein
LRFREAVRCLSQRAARPRGPTRAALGRGPRFLPGFAELVDLHIHGLGEYRNGSDGTGVRSPQAPSSYAPFLTDFRLDRSFA